MLKYSIRLLLLIFFTSLISCSKAPTRVLYIDGKEYMCSYSDTTNCGNTFYYCSHKNEKDMIFSCVKDAKFKIIE